MQPGVTGEAERRQAGKKRRELSYHSNRTFLWTPCVDGEPRAVDGVWKGAIAQSVMARRKGERATFGLTPPAAGCSSHGEDAKFDS
jgi:hypothetical protein